MFMFVAGGPAYSHASFTLLSKSTDDGFGAIYTAMLAIHHSLASVSVSILFSNLLARCFTLLRHKFPDSSSCNSSCTLTMMKSADTSLAEGAKSVKLEMASNESPD